MRQFLLLYCCLCSIALFGQTAPDCQDMLKKAKAFERNNELSKAVQFYLNALNCNSGLGSEIGPRLKGVFEKIEEQKAILQLAEENLNIDKQKAIIAELIAMENLERANKLVGYFQFDGNSAAWAYKDGYFALIDTLGNQLTDYKYESPEQFENGICIAKKGKGFVLINEKGTELTPALISIVLTEADIYKAYDKWVYRKDDNTIGYYNNFIKISADSFLFQYQMYDLWGLRNLKGDILAEPQWETPFDASFLKSEHNQTIETKKPLIKNSITPFEKDGLWGLQNQNGTVLIRPQYQQIDVLKNGCFIYYAGHDWKIGVLTHQGKLLTEGIYDHLELHPDSTMELTLKERQGLVNPDDGQIIPTEYDDVWRLSNGLYAVQRFNKWGLLDRHGFMLVPCRFDDGEDFYTNGLAWVKENNLWGLIDSRGQYRLQPVYDNLQYFKNNSLGLIGAEKNGLWGLVDSMGNEWLAPQYKQLLSNDKDLFWGFDGANWKIFDQFGAIPAMIEGNMPFGDGNGHYFIGSLGAFEQKPAASAVNYKYLQGQDIFPSNGSASQGVVYGFGSGQPIVLEMEAPFLELPDNEGEHFTPPPPPPPIMSIRSPSDFFPWGLIDASGRLVISAHLAGYSFYPYGPNGNYYRINKSGNNSEMHGLVYSNTGKVAVPTIFEDVLPWTNRYCWVKAKGQWGLFNIIKSTFQLEPKYKSIKWINNQLWQAQENNSNVLVNAEAEIGTFIYDETDNYNPDSNFIRVSRGGHYGAVNDRGELIVPIEYIDLYKTGRFIIMRGEKNIQVTYNSNKTMQLENPAEIEWINPLFIGSGYWNYNGEIYITTLGTTDRPLLIVKKKGKLGLIDLNNQTLLPCAYDEVFQAKDSDLVLFREGDKMGFYSLHTGQKQSLSYEKIVPLVEDGIFGFHQNGYWGLLDSTGKVLVEAIYDDLSDREKNGYVCLIKGTEKTFVALNGQRSNRFIYPDFFHFNGRETALSYKNGKAGLINRQGEYLLRPEYDDLKDADFNRNNCTLAKQNGHWGMFRLSDGAQVLSTEYDSIFVFKKENYRILGGYILQPPIFLKQGVKWGWADTLGNILVAPSFQFDDITPFENDLAWFQKDSLWGVVRLNGEIVFEAQFSEQSQFIDGHAIVIKNELFGVVREDGSIVAPFQYNQINICGYHSFLLKNNDINGAYYGLVNADKKINLAAEYDKIGWTGEENDLIRVQKNGKWGWVKHNGENVIPCKYDAAGPFRDGAAFVFNASNNQFYYINSADKVVVNR